MMPTVEILGGKFSFTASVRQGVKQNMFLRFQRIALDVSYVFGRNRSMFLIVVFLIKKACISTSNHLGYIQA